MVTGASMGSVLAFEFAGSNPERQCGRLRSRNETSSMPAFRRGGVSQVVVLFDSYGVPCSPVQKNG